MSDNTKDLLTILLIEDNEGDIMLTNLALEEAGFDCNLMVVKDVQEGLDLIYQRNAYASSDQVPDLVFLDLNLPGLHGTEFLKEVRNTESKLQTVPIIVLTTSDADRDIAEVFELKANMYVVKPVNFPKLVYVFEKIKEYWKTSISTFEVIKEY